MWFDQISDQKYDTYYKAANKVTKFKFTKTKYDFRSDCSEKS